MKNILRVFVAAVITRTKNNAWLILKQGCILSSFFIVEIIFSKGLYNPTTLALFNIIGILLVIIGAVLITSKIFSSNLFKG